MLKIEVKDDDGSKLFYGDGIQFVETKVMALPYNELVIFTRKGKVKSGMFLLHPGDMLLFQKMKKS